MIYLKIDYFFAEILIGHIGLQYLAFLLKALCSRI